MLLSGNGVMQPYSPNCIVWSYVSKMLMPTSLLKSTSFEVFPWEKYNSSQYNLIRKAEGNTMCSVCSLAENSFQNFLKVLFELKLFLEKASCIGLKVPRIKNPPKLFKVQLLLNTWLLHWGWICRLSVSSCHMFSLLSAKLKCMVWHYFHCRHLQTYQVTLQLSLFK